MVKLNIFSPIFPVTIFSLMSFLTIMISARRVDKMTTAHLNIIISKLIPNTDGVFL